MEITLTEDNFTDEVIKSPVPIMVDFWAEWCTPCLLIAPALSEIAETYNGRFKIGKLNVDQYPKLASTYNVRSIPNLKIFKGGKIADEIIGAVPKDVIVKRIEKII